MVAADGHPWGRMERKSTFLAAGGDPALWHGLTELLLLPGTVPTDIFRPGASPVSYADLAAEQNVDDAGTPLFDDGNDNPVTDDRGFGRYQHRRRLWQVSETLPGDVDADLVAFGEYTVSPIARFNSFIKLSRDGNLAGPPLVLG